MVCEEDGGGWGGGVGSRWGHASGPPLELMLPLEPVALTRCHPAPPAREVGPVSVSAVIGLQH